MLRTLGRTLQLEALCLLPPLVTALLYREDPAAVCLYHRPGGPAGHGPVLPKAKPEFYSREGYAVVGLIWLTLSLFGPCPFSFRGISPPISTASSRSSPASPPRLLHLNGRRGPAPRHPVLAVVFLLDRRHGRADLHPGLPAQGGRADPGARPGGGHRPRLLQAGAQDVPLLPDPVQHLHASPGRRPWPVPGRDALLRCPADVVCHAAPAASPCATPASPPTACPPARSS